MGLNHYALNHSGDATTIFNPSPLPGPAEIVNFPWHKVDWLIVNEGEALDLYKAFTNTDLEKCTAIRNASEPESIREVIVSLSEQSSLSKTNIICTLGKHGVLAFMPVFHKPKSPCDATTFLYLPAAELKGSTRDTTGAGDCFTGYFVECLMEFGPHAIIGTEVQEEDVARILKICVQVDSGIFWASYHG